MAEYAGYLAKIEVNIDSVYTEVAQVRDLNGPAAESDQIEVSHRDSRWRRFVAGMRDGGEVTFEVVFDPDHPSHDPADPDSMYAKLENGVVDDYRITFPGAAGATTTAEFEAFVSQFSVKAPLEDGQMADLTLKITGEIEWEHVAAP